MKQTHKTHKSWAKSFILLLLLILPTTALTAEKSVKDLAALGNEAFGRGNFDEADSLYSEALKKEPGETALIYNRANVLYKIEKFFRIFDWCFTVLGIIFE